MLALRSVFHPSALAWVALFAALSGCSKDPAAAPAAATGGGKNAASTAGETPAGTSAVTADGVLDAMAQAYRKAKSYADAGRVELQATINGQPENQVTPFSVTFERPNKLRLHAYQGNLISDGQELRGWLDTQPGQVFHGHVLASEAPPQVSMENLSSDPILKKVLTEGIAASPVQLLLLVDSDPLAKIQDQAERPVLLQPEAIDEHMCHRVLMAKPEGKLVLWIDHKSFVLRRMEVPVEGFQAHLSKQPGVKEVKDVSLRAEFAGARLADVDEKAFEFTPPRGAKLVKLFDPRELLPPAPQQLGKPAPAFSVTALDGKPIDRDSLMGRIAVIDFWFTTCPPCRLSLPNLEQIYQKYKDNDLVRFVAVSVDEEEIKDDALTSLFSELKVSVPIARDPIGKFAQAIGVPGFPTLVVLGADGVVESFEMGYNPQLVTSLSAKLDKLLTGESIYKEALKTEYRESTAESTPAAAPAEGATEIPRAEIAAKSDPKTLKLTKLWSNEELQQPGNLLVISDGESPKILMNDGWKHVAELSAEGKLLGRHKLEIPDDDVVAALRTTVDKDGRRLFLGLASSRQQVHVFDDQWKTVLSYPPDRDHAGVADAHFADLDADGRTELLVSYWGVVGVQGVNLEGKRLWANRSLEHVFRLAVTSPESSGRRRVLCTHSRGTLVPINHEGVADAPIAVGSSFLRSIHTAPPEADGPPRYLAIASNAEGQDTALGLNLAGEELWNHPLPRGVQKHPLEFVAWGDVVGNGHSQWLLAGPDGSLHVLAADGELLDQFNYGVAIAGLSVTKINGKPALLIATASGLDAWSVK